MKHSYHPKTSWLRWLCLCLLLALPGLGMAQTLTFASLSPGDPQDFGSVQVGNVSASKSYSVNGSELTRNVIIAIPADFEGSVDNSAFSASNITLVPSSGSVSTTVYLRFRPATTGVVNNDLVAGSRGAPTTYIGVTGTGTPGAPTITVNPNALTGYGSQAVGTTSAQKSVAVTGSSLTADILVQAPTGFLVSSDNVTYAATATLTRTGSTVNTTLYVKFKPTTAGAINGDVTLTSTGAADKTVSVSGTGVPPPPVLNVSTTALTDFGSVVVGATSNITGSFTVDGTNLQGNVTIAPPLGFRIRTGTNVFSTNPIVLTPTNGTLANTTINVLFTPVAAQLYSSAISVSSPNGAGTLAQSVTVSGTGTATSGTAALNVTPGALDFGTVTGSGSANVLRFDVSGTDLTADMVLTPSATNIKIRNASAGDAFSNGPITLVRTGGTVPTQTIEVELVATVPAGPYSQKVDVTSTGAPATFVSLTANNPGGVASNISVTSVAGYDYTFATRPNTVSASQIYQLAATNLLQDLVVAPSGINASYFQLSSDNVTWSSQLSFTPDNQGNVTQRPVYVRFVPGNNTVTVSATIRNSSAPASAGDLSVTGISEPTLRLSRPIGGFSTYTVRNTHSDPVAVRLDGFLLSGDVDVRFPADLDDVGRNPGFTAQYEFSLDNGATYVKTTTITPDGAGNFTRNLLVRFAPVRVGNAVQSMQFRNDALHAGTYHELASGNGAATGYAIDYEPGARSVAIVTRAPGATSAVVSFNLSNPPAGNGYGRSRLVIASTTYQRLPRRLFPLDKQNFSSGATVGGDYQFGAGQAIEASSETYVVFSGQPDNFTVGNLDPSKEYYFFAFEFNNDGLTGAENYLLPSNQSIAPLPVGLLAFGAQRHGQQVDLNWATASEKNSRSFEVERSADGKKFSTVLSKAAQGSTSARTDYTAADRRPLPGLAYYRLKLVDLDGTQAYSPVVTVAGDGQVEIGIYPNPTAGKVTIRVPESLATSAPRVRISDLMGRVVLELALPATGEVDLGALPTGTYLLNVGGQQVHTRLVKY